MPVKCAVYAIPLTREVELWHNVRCFRGDQEFNLLVDIEGVILLLSDWSVRQQQRHLTDTTT
jgi:hypothetical protein